MKIKKIISLLCVAALSVGMLAGCEKGGAGSDGGNGGNGNSGGGGTTTAQEKPMRIEVFDVAANYQGVQSGWFAKVVKDRFNLELSILAPQVSGDQLYQTRTADGNLGDLVLLDAGQFQDCVKAGLLKDVAADIYSYENLKTYKQQIDTLNAGLPDNDGKLYGIPTEMVNTSPTSYTQDVIYSSPMLRWDLYKEIGSPDIQDLDGLLDALEEMMKVNPTNDAGEKTYGMSLWPDWDNNDNMIGIANAVQLTTWYGEKIKQSVILKPDGSFIPLTDKNGSYYKMMKFLFDAYQRGLVDPDSATQKWDDACTKMKDGRVFLMWYSWQVGFWNNAERLKNGSAFIFIPVKDQTYYQDADSFFGSGRVFAVGAGVDDTKYKKIMEFLDWYASPEGVMYQHNGLEGFNYEVRDGRYYKINDDALMTNMDVPEEFGGGKYADGNNQINQWIVSANSTNPLTGERYASTQWATYKEATEGQMKEEWRQRFDAQEPSDYMKKNNVLLISPNVSVALPTDNNDISDIRNRCKGVVKEFSWKMIYAKDEAEFNSLWDEMTKMVNDMGFESLMEYDIETYTIELKAKQAVK